MFVSVTAYLSSRQTLFGTSGLDQPPRSFYYDLVEENERYLVCSLDLEAA
ncbi:hypothetical protein SY94_5279 (plasmid) [Agrobacterium tumefaciens]|nr:hypothetical protein SY94_5279 [Agrobacterium tumefaciens]